MNSVAGHEFPLMFHMSGAVLDNQPDILVVGCASGVEGAVELVLHNGVDMVTRLPDRGTTRLMNLLVEKAASVKILVLGITESRKNVLR